MPNPSAKRFSGVIPPLVTPRRCDRSFDPESFRRVIERVLAAGVHGVFVLGSTGEVAFMEDDMRRSVIAEAVEAVAGRVPVLVGAIDTQTARVQQHVDEAVALGADAVVATAPFYAITNEPQIERHFELLAERTPVPIFAYDIPVCVHVKPSIDLLLRLGHRGVLMGVKDSSGDDVSFRRLLLRNRQEGEPLVVLTGHEVVVDGAYLSGAHGSVPGLGNVDPAGYVALHEAAVRGDWAAARAEQDRLAQLMEIAFSARSVTGWGAGVGSFKTALRLQGIIADDQLPEPFERLSEEDAIAIGKVLAIHGPTL